MGWIRLLIEKKINNVPFEMKLVCKKFFGVFIDTKILKVNEENCLLEYIATQTAKNWNWTLMYRASEHGFKRDDFYKYCRDKTYSGYCS